MIVAFTLVVFSLATSAQCNLDKQTTNTSSGSARPSPGPSYAAWLDEDVRWIVTDGNRAKFYVLKSNNERDRFIEQFWSLRDPTPNTFVNEYRQEHYRRLLYANEHFLTVDTPGWKTDRGRMYIVHGEPDKVTSQHKDGEQKEVWRYRYLEGIGQEVDIEFVDRCRCGKFEQVTDVEHLRKSELEMASFIDSLMPSSTVPAPKFRDLYEIVAHRICMSMVPLSVTTKLEKLTDYTTLVPITVNVADKDVTWREMPDGTRQKTLNIYARVTPQSGHAEELFEGIVAHRTGQAGEEFTFLYTAPLRSGAYRIDVVVKDVADDRKGTWTGTIDVP